MPIPGGGHDTCHIENMTFVISFRKILAQTQRMWYNYFVIEKQQTHERTHDMKQTGLKDLLNEAIEMNDKSNCGLDFAVDVVRHKHGLACGSDHSRKLHDMAKAHKAGEFPHILYIIGDLEYSFHQAQEAYNLMVEFGVEEDLLVWSWKDRDYVHVNCNGFTNACFALDPIDIPELIASFRK